MKKPTLRTISAEDLEHLQIDDKRQLYWNGERIRNQITLTWFQTFAAIVAVVAGVATIANGAASGINNAATFVCARGWNFPYAGCPIQPTQPPTASTAPGQRRP